MVEQSDSEDRLDRLFHALSDRTRRAILRRLTKEEACAVTELAAPFDMSLNAVSKHLKVLEAAGLLTRTKDGRVHRCSADFSRLSDVADTVSFYQSFWNNRLDELDNYLQQAGGKSRREKKRER